MCPRPILPASSAHAAVLAQTRQRQAAHAAALAAFLTDPQAPITLEIGCGHGHFLTAYAVAHPQEPCVGLDLIGFRIERAKRKQRLAGLQNTCFLKAEAFEFLEILKPEHRLGRIFILFADPWPKRRHHTRRLLRPEMLDVLARHSDAGAQLCFRTDSAPFFADALECLKAHPLWTWEATAPWPFEAPSFFQDLHPEHQSFVASRNTVEIPLVEQIHPKDQKNLRHEENGQ